MKDPLENIPQWGCLRLAVGFVARSPWFHRLFLSRGSAGGQARCGLRLRSGGGEHVSDALGRSEAVAGAVQVLFRGRVTQRSACSMFFFPRSQHEQWPSNFISYKSAHWIISPFTSIKIKGFVQAIAGNQPAIAARSILVGSGVGSCFFGIYHPVLVRPQFRPILIFFHLILLVLSHIWVSLCSLPIISPYLKMVSIDW